MNILVISENLPEEIGGMRLLYEILLAYTGNDEIDLICFEKEECKIILPDNIEFIPWTKATYYKKNGSPFYKKFFIQKRLANYRRYVVKAQKYDAIVGFSYHNLAFNFEGFSGKYYNIAMDSAALLFLRGLINHTDIKLKLACLIRLLQVIRTEKYVSKISTCSYTVGVSDANMYKYLFNSNAKYVPHPYNPNSDGKKAIVWNGEDKLRICFAGALSHFYTGELLVEICNEFINKKDEFNNKVEFFFLGNCYCQDSLEKLKKAGYTVNTCAYAESFEDYLCNTHLLMVPLMVGAGTKNRVLNALSLGLDLISTSIGVENIQGVKEQYIANDAEQFVSQLRLRLESKKLFNFSENEISELKKYHSGNQWKKLFWNEIL